MKTGKFYAALIFCSISVNLWAADFTVSASLDRNQISLNEQAVLSLTISGSGGDFPQPQLPGLSDEPSEALGINLAGNIVGYSRLGPFGPTHAVLWRRQ